MVGDCKKRPMQLLVATKSAKGKVNITRLKKSAQEHLPRNWPLREVLPAENEEIGISTFLARLPVWLQLDRLKGVDDK